MDEKSVDAIVETFRRPACRMISATLMGALIGSNLDQQEANRRMEAVRPLLGRYAQELESPLAEMFSVNAIVWSLPENVRSGFFAGEDLSLRGLVKVVQDGANAWHRYCREKDISERRIVPLFTALKALLLALFDGQVAEGGMAADFLKLQDNLVESFDWE